MINSTAAPKKQNSQPQKNVSSPTEKKVTEEKHIEGNPKANKPRTIASSTNPLAQKNMDINFTAKQCCGKGNIDAVACVEGIVDAKVDNWLKSLYKKHSQTYYLATGDYAESFKNEKLTLSKLCSVHLDYTSHESFFGLMREGQFKMRVTNNSYKNIKEIIEKQNEKIGKESGYFYSYLNKKPDDLKYVSREIADCLRKEAVEKKGKTNGTIKDFLNLKNGSSCMK